jgi:hypothetical protein
MRRKPLSDRSTLSRLVARQRIKPLRQPVDAERTEVRRRLAAGIKKDERGLRDDLEVLPDRPSFVNDVIERTHVVFVDELVDWIKTISSGDADEGDVGSICCLDLCDRRGFTLANSSPWRPEPQQNVLAAQRVEIKLVASGSRHKHRFEVSWQLGRHGRVCRRARASVGFARPATSRYNEHRCCKHRHRKLSRTHEMNLMKTRHREVGRTYDTS